MELFIDATGATIIILEPDEAHDLKAACETPEYHGPILVKLANELAALDKAEFADPGYDDSGTAKAPPYDYDEAVVPDSEDSAHVELTPLAQSPEIATLNVLERQHGHATEGANVPDRYALYFFEDGSSFYIQPDGSYTERWEPDTTPDEGVASLVEDFEAAADAFDILLGVDAPDVPEPPDMLSTPPPAKSLKSRKA